MEAVGVRPVRIVEIINPFREDIRTGEVILAPRPGEFLDACMLRAGLNAADYAIRLNDALIEPGEEAFHVVKPGAQIVCSAAAGGSALRMIATIGVMIAAMALTDGFAATAFGEVLAWGGLGLSASTSALVTAALTIGGNMLISAFMGPGNGTANSASNTYDPTGPKTLAQPGTPIPKAYGTMGWAGNIISSFVDEDGKDEYLNILVAFGFGAATSVQDVYINQKPISSFPDLSYQFRYGANDQTPIPGFDTIRNVYPQEIDLLEANGPTIVTGQGTNTTGLQIAVKFPGGVMRTDSGGTPKEVTFAYKVEVSPSGEGAWTTPIFPRTTADVYTVDANGFRHYPAWVVMPTDRYAGSGIVYATGDGGVSPGEVWNHTQTVTIYNVDNTTDSYNTTFIGEWQPTSDLELDIFTVSDWWGGWRLVSNMTDQSFYDVVNVYGLTSGKWDCRVTKWGAGPHNNPIPQGDAYMTDPHYTADGWLWDVTEIQFTDLAYPNMCLLGIRALATSQLAGADITVLATWVHDIGADTVLPTALAGFEHDNPAIVAYDILMNPLYGMASSAPNITVDIPAFVKWAQFCDELVPTSAGGTQRRFVFAGVFDTGGSNAWQVLQQVASMSRASVTRSGLNYSVWVDAPTDITQVFTDANISRGSYAETFIAFDDRASLVEATFADATRNWRTDLPVSVMTATTINSGLQPKVTRVNLLGCVDRDQAWQWSYFNLLSTETLLRTATWKAGIEAVTCRQGSVVGVQQRQWALGGRVQAGSTATTLIIDRTDLPAYAGGAGWTVGVQHPVVEVGAATIQTVTSVGNNSYLVTFTANLPAGRILHVSSAGGAEATVQGVTQASGANSNSLTMGSVQGAFTAGQVVTLYDYDRIELQAVTAVNGLDIAIAGFSQAPTPDAPWFYSQSAGGAPYKTFRVTGIKQSGDFEMEISGLEYNPSIYIDPIPNYGAIVSFPSVSAGVTSVALLEKLQYTTNTSKPGTQALVTVAWDNGPNTSTVDVWGSVDGGATNIIGLGAPKTGYSFLASTGDVWTITVVGRDQFGVASPFNTAPSQTITVQGTGAAPGSVTSLTGNLQTGTLILTWVAPAGSPTAATYEVRYNTDATDNNWNNGAQIAMGLTSPTYTITNPGSGLYMVKALSSTIVESVQMAGWALTTSSSPLNGVGSIAPGQALVVTVGASAYDATSGKCSCTLTMDAQMLERTDGTNYSVPAAALVYTEILAPATTYYLYTTLKIADGTLHVAGGDPPTLPPTAPSATLALQACNDGYYQGPQITVTTPTTAGTGGGSFGGGAGECPDSREWVTTLERGIVRAGTVTEGEHLLGYCFEIKGAVYRRVLSVRKRDAWTWYKVNGYRMSPMDPVWIDGEWQPPYRVGEFDGGPGERIQIAIEADRYDQQNYYLFGRDEELLIHNQQILPCYPLG